MSGKTKFGQFDNTNKEYIINTPFTPLPWINYIGNDNLYGIISHTAGGYTFYKDARLRRITRYRYNNIPMDINGRYIYIKLHDDIYSPTYKPCMKKLKKYKTHHGMGYTRITSEYRQIATNLCYFIPRSDNIEIWDMKIKNCNKHKKIELILYPFVEFCLWEALDDFTNFQRNFNTGEVLVENNTVFHITEYRERRNHLAYFTSTEKPLSFETRLKEFIGPSGTIHIPEMIKKSKLDNGLAYGWSPIAVFQIKVKLKPEEEKRIAFFLGYQENPDKQKFIKNRINTTKAQQTINKYKNFKQIDNEFKNLNTYWQQLLSKFQVCSANKYINTMVNIWNQYQNIITYKMSRSTSLFETGIGRGMGFRDSNQDLLGFMHIDPQKAKQRIYDLASTQLMNGHAYHQYQPLTKKGNSDFGSNYNDDPLWLILSTAAYLKETGDFNFLQKYIPFENDLKKSSLYEHLKRALFFTINNKGPHGLPLIGRADWNDCINLNTRNTEPGVLFSNAPTKDGKTAESTLIGMLFVYAAREFEKITILLNRKKDRSWIQKEIQVIKTALEKYGWDSQWWLRGYDNKKKKFGSQKNQEGKIYIEPQGWAILAGIGSEKQQQKALNSVKQYLATEHGINLVYPAYRQYDLDLGEISTYPPGYKENGSTFCHSNPWIIIGEALLKNKKQAMDYYLSTCPAKREEISPIHQCEPYVYAQTIAGKEAPTFGEAKNSWLTGTASWSFIATSQYLLGIQPDYHGLIIQPCLPDDFGDYQVQRFFRGTKYNLKICFTDTASAYLIENNKTCPGNYIQHKSGIRERNIRIIIPRNQ